MRLALILALAGGPALATGLEIDVAGEATGTIVVDLFEDVAPNHVAQIVALAEEGAYDGVVFHRVIEGFMAQTGDVENGNMERDFNNRAGFTTKDDTLPKRLLTEPAKTGPAKGMVNRLGDMLPQYYEIRGWDAEGRLKPDTRERLGL